MPAIGAALALGTGSLAVVSARRKRRSEG